MIADENVLIEVGVVDATEHLNDKVLSELGAKRYDYRLVAATPTGGVVSFHRGATADDVVAYWQRQGWLVTDQRHSTQRGTDATATNPGTVTP